MATHLRQGLVAKAPEATLRAKVKSIKFTWSLATQVIRQRLKKAAREDLLR